MTAFETALDNLGSAVSAHPQGLLCPRRSCLLHPRRCSLMGRTGAGAPAQPGQACAFSVDPPWLKGEALQRCGEVTLRDGRSSV